MNYAVIGRILSWVLRTEGLLMLLPCLIALIYGEWQGLVYLALGVGAIAAGWLLSRKKIANPAIYQREGFVSVGLSWVVLSLYGAIPFVITGEIPVFLDALFEIVSGFTTTGCFHIGQCGGALSYKPVLAELFPLDWRDGRLGLHSHDDPLRQRWYADQSHESGKPRS